MLLNHKTFFIKEHVAMMKLAGAYDIYDPETNNQIGIAKEEPGGLVKYSRLLLSKALLPNKVNVYDAEQNPVFSINKPFSLLRSKVSIHNKDGEYMGYFKSKIMTLGGGFFVYDANENQVAEIKGDWKGWNFKFNDANGRELGSVTKKWAGLGKELFTSADNYVIALDEATEHTPEICTLLLAAGLAIDTIYKENK